MGESSLITNVVVWERRLEYDAQQRQYHPAEPYVDYLAAVPPASGPPAAPRPGRKERPSILARLLGWVKRPGNRPASAVPLPRWPEGALPAVQACRECECRPARKSGLSAD